LPDVFPAWCAAWVTEQRLRVPSERLARVASAAFTAWMVDVPDWRWTALVAEGLVRAATSQAAGRPVPCGL
jgi:hypothetical protein